MEAMPVNDYINRDAAMNAAFEGADRWDGGCCAARDLFLMEEINKVPAADVVPWEFLERYADYFCAVVSMPEFVREAKAFYKDTYRVMANTITK